MAALNRIPRDAEVNICIICADPAVGRSISAVLGAHNIECRILETPEELSSGEIDAPDGIIVDLMVRPDVLHRSLKALAGNANDVPIVVLDGLVPEATRQKITRNYSQIRFLSSPIDTDELLSLLEEMGAISD